MNLAYDFEANPRGSLGQFLQDWAGRFGLDADVKKEVGDIMSKYSVRLSLSCFEKPPADERRDVLQIYASRRKAELLDDHTYSLINWNE